MRRAAKVDSNQKEIVDGLRKYGVDVISIAQVGKDCPDIIAGFRKKNFLMEIKPSEKSKLRPGQAAFAMWWRGQVARVNSLEDALRVVGVL